MYEIELFIDDNYLTVYKNTKLYYLQKKDTKSNTLELKSYLKSSLCLENLQVIEKEEIKLEKTSSHEFIKLIKSNLFNYFLIYLLILCIGFYSLDFTKKDDINKFKTLQIRTSSLKNDTEFKFISKELISLYIEIKKSNLLISSLSFKESKFIFNLESKEKKKIYKLLEKIKNSTIENIIFNEKSKRYIANASFRVYRK